MTSYSEVTLPAVTHDDNNASSLPSALYVVDLKKFRKIAAGDRLRGQYQGLSQDPNSLSNLDQVSGCFCLVDTSSSGFLIL